ncbi:MAG: type IV pilus assembly protein PilV [Gammaproteobacteria bacterium]|nr:MAG: type IV pilus assembly protein PilV [Gammaproteobacteria bacterium]TND06689.1 MAG: type IV pilus assembly protein PilV [Gammaproteobacteria bacterium]
MTPNHHMTIPGRSRGSSLMEVLVTVVVLSIGLLGLAGLQLTGLRANGAAEARSVATLLAYDMTDRMRANNDGVISGAYNAVDGSETDPGCISTGCTAAQLAVYDAWQWNQKLSTTPTLPSGTGRVTGNGATFTVTVMWDESRTGATGTGCGTNQNVDRKCLAIQVQP